MLGPTARSSRRARARDAVRMRSGEEDRQKSRPAVRHHGRPFDTRRVEHGQYVFRLCFERELLGKPSGSERPDPLVSKRISRLKGRQAPEHAAVGRASPTRNSTLLAPSATNTRSGGPSPKDLERDVSAVVGLGVPGLGEVAHDWHSLSDQRPCCSGSSATCISPALRSFVLEQRHRSTRRMKAGATHADVMPFCAPWRSESVRAFGARVRCSTTCA